MSSLVNGKLVEDNYVLDSRRCNKIINVKTGTEFVRSTNEIDRWEFVFKYAKKNPDEFECEYDREIAASGTEDDKVYEEGDLRPLSMPKLQSIAKPLGVTGRSKDEIIKRILEAQKG